MKNLAYEVTNLNSQELMILYRMLLEQEESLNIESEKLNEVEDERTVTTNSR